MPLRSVLGRALAASILLAAAPALAVAPHTQRRAIDAEWVATAAAKLPAPLRLVTDVEWNRPARAAAWRRFTDAAPGRWQSTWDKATGVPARIWGEGVPAPGVMADPAAAASFARAFLAAHLDLLAPGASIGDFELVANVSDGDIRSVGFFQRHAGLRVVGGQVGFEFKRDRLIVIHSEALPAVAVQLPRARLDAATVASRARAATVRDVGLADAQVGAPAAPVILPLVADDRVLGYRVAVPVAVDAGASGRWTVYADPATGEPLVRHQDLRFASGTVQYDAVDRWPGGTRHYVAAARVQAQVNGDPQTTGADGKVSWTGTTPAQVVSGVVGDLVTVVDSLSPSESVTADLPDGGTVQWSEAATDTLDAEVQAFVHVQIVKAYVRTFAPDLTWLDNQMTATVNIDDTCNAYYAGGTVNFFKAGNGCANTGTVADVIYHEVEHGVHEHAIIPGLGEFEGALSEGQSDFVAASITGDPQMGVGFYGTDKPLRDIDPPDMEWRWPEGISEIHQTGLIFSGAMWDLRKQLIADLGPTEGVAVTNRLFYAAIQRASNIPATFVEVLAADDDDGNLANGTPHECAIRAAFGLHGLRDLGAHATQPGVVAAPDGQTTTPIDVSLDGLSARCPSDQIDTIVMAWSPRSGALPKAGNVAMTMGADPAHWRADLPLPPDGGQVRYQVHITFKDGSDTYLPDNRADPYYVLYQGETVPLYCTDFETDPFQGGWTHSSAVGNDDWQWGAPTAPTTSGDPAAAYSGTNLVGTNLSGDGRYSDSSVMRLRSPVIDLGQYSDVHLQYRRMLAVQDGWDDQATIYASGEQAWQNAGSDGGQRQKHSIDREWVFDDVPLSGHLSKNQVQLTFELASNGGYALGGWNIDDVCVVANAHAFCGDGIKQGTEQCDDGDANANVPDACRTFCRRPTCGDGIVDTGEACDLGADNGGDACATDCTIPMTGGGGCCDAGGAPLGGPIALALVVGVLALGRRRRRA